MYGLVRAIFFRSLFFKQFFLGDTYQFCSMLTMIYDEYEIYIFVQIEQLSLAQQTPIS